MLTFLAPLALALTALLLPIIALYLLKLRRQDHLVSSVYLWQRFVRDVEANAPWQKLRRNLLLLLQILFMLALILALTRPATPAEGVSGQTVVLVFDASASMGTTDGDGGRTSRLQAAQAAARALVTNLPADARLTVIAAAGGEAEILTSATQNRRQALEALAGVDQTLLNSDLTPALALAEAIVAREPAAEIILFSDGAGQMPDQMAAPARFVPVGQAGANQAISALAVTPAATGQPGLFVQVSNYGDQPARRRLVIQADGSPVTAFDLDLRPNGHAEQLIDSLPETAQTVEAYLTPAETDFLAVDDRAWTVLAQDGPTQVTLVTSGNYFLRTALSLLDTQPSGSRLELTIVNPEDWSAKELQPSNLPPVETFQPSLHIFDSFVPPNLPPGNLLFIAPDQPVPGLFEVLGQVANPDPQPELAEHPLLRHVELAGAQILTTTVLSTTAWSRIVATGQTATGDVPLLLAGEKEGRRVVLLPFALQQSDLPLRPAFPILMANLVDYLAPGRRSLVPAQLSPGQARSFSLPPQVSAVSLTGPNDRQRNIEVDAGRATLPPLAEAGLYHLVLAPAGETIPFAVNFFDPRESTIIPQPDRSLIYRASPETQAAELPPAYREWWRPLAAGALLLLVVEWLVYQRSAVFKAWSKTRAWVTRKV